MKQKCKKNFQTTPNLIFLLSSKPMWAKNLRYFSDRKLKLWMSTGGQHLGNFKGLRGTHYLKRRMSDSQLKIFNFGVSFRVIYGAETWKKLF